MRWLLTRTGQMVGITVLTAITLIFIYVLIGWQAGGHGPQDIPPIFWQLEAGAWGLRALVESWALIYLFQTVSKSRILVAFEIALIGLIAVTVGLVIIANGNGQALAKGLPGPLYWVWSFAASCFAPLMLGGVGYAYKIHETVLPVPDEVVILQAQVVSLTEAVNLIPGELAKIQVQVVELAEVAKAPLSELAALQAQVAELAEAVKAARTTERTADRRQEVGRLKSEGFSQAKIAGMLGVSVGTIRADVKALNGSGK